MLKSLFIFYCRLNQNVSETVLKSQFKTFDSASPGISFILNVCLFDITLFKLYTVVCYCILYVLSCMLLRLVKICCMHIEQQPFLSSTCQPKRGLHKSCT